MSVVAVVLAASRRRGQPEQLLPHGGAGPLRLPGDMDTRHDYRALVRETSA